MLGVIFLLLVSNIAFAEEVIPTESPVSAEQQTDSALTPEPAPQEKEPDTQGSEQPTAPPADPPADETPEEEEDADQPTLEPKETEPALDSNEEPSEMQLNFIVRWVVDAPNGVLLWGDEFTLEAEICPEMTGLQLQWQVATKPATDLAEDEPEWVDISGASDLTHTFTTEKDMRTWRWRLRVSLAEGDTVYSQEMTLPHIASAEEDESLDEEAMPDSEDADELPVAKITFIANMPEDEITYGTQIELFAEILNPREDMLLQWQYMPEEEDAWQDISGATEIVFTYVLDEENAEWLWRLLITVPTDAEIEEEAPDSDDVDVME